MAGQTDGWMDDGMVGWMDGQNVEDCELSRGIYHLYPTVGEIGSSNTFGVGSVTPEMD